MASISTNSNNKQPLSAESILNQLKSAQPSLRSASDAAILAIHSGFLQRGFKCIATNDQKPTTDNNTANTTTTDNKPTELPSIPPNWNNSTDSYTFQYIHSNNPNQSILLKAIRLDNQLLIHAAKKDIKSNTTIGGLLNLDLTVTDWINEDELNNYDRLYRDLNGLLTIINQKLIEPLTPPEQPKPVSTATATAQQEQRPIDPSYSDPLRVIPRNPLRPYDPDFDGDFPYYDPIAVNQPAPLAGGRFGPRPDFAGDLDPLAAGRYGGGNLMGPDQLLQRAGPNSGMQGQPRGAGPGMVPRYDPYGPIPGLGEPDNDLMPPPGSRGPRAGPSFGPNPGQFGGFGSGGRFGSSGPFF